MHSKLRKYRAATEAAERWMDEIKKEIEPVYLKYRGIVGDRAGDYFPPSIDSISEYNGMVHIDGVSYSRGCSNRLSCKLPAEIFYGTSEDRERIFTQMTEQKSIAANEAKLAKQIALEEIERQQLALLKSKYEGTNHVG